MNYCYYIFGLRLPFGLRFDLQSHPPMIAIQIADFFLLKRDKSSLAVHIPNLIIWVIGFVVYRILMNIDMPLGNTLPDMVITIVICLIVGKFVS